MIDVKNLTKWYHRTLAVDDVSFCVDKGSVVGFLGPNGAGKTTFMDIVAGKTRADSGEVLWGAKNISLLKKSEHEIATLGIGRKFQRPTVFEEQSVGDNLMMALRNKRGPLDVLFYYFNDDDQLRVQETAEEIGLKDHVGRRAGELSHGQKQWLEIGMLLAQDPRLLLVDEPAAGMTGQERDHTVKLLRKMAETRAVVVVEHDMEFVRNLECKVTVLHEGSILDEGSLDHVIQNQEVIDVYLGR